MFKYKKASEGTHFEVMFRASLRVVNYKDVRNNHNSIIDDVVSRLKLNTSIIHMFGKPIELVKINKEFVFIYIIVKTPCR